MVGRLARAEWQPGWRDPEALSGGKGKGKERERPGPATVPATSSEVEEVNTSPKRPRTTRVFTSSPPATPLASSSSASLSSLRSGASSPERTPRPPQRANRDPIIIDDSDDDESPAGADEPQFLPEEVAHLKEYLLLSSTVALTTCAAVALTDVDPPSALRTAEESFMPELGFWKTDERLFPEPEWNWRIRSVRIPKPSLKPTRDRAFGEEATTEDDSDSQLSTSSRSRRGEAVETVDLQVQGEGWPVRVVKLCGWLVSQPTFVPAERPKQTGGKLEFLLDDGTAVLKCLLDIKPSTRMPRSAGATRTLRPRKKTAPSSSTKAKASNEATADYRRKPSPIRLRFERVTLEEDPAAVHVASVANYFCSIPVGSTLAVVGTVKRPFSGQASGAFSSLQVSSCEVERDPMEEIRHRRRVKELRRAKYAGKFRLDEEWEAWRGAGTSPSRTTSSQGSRSSQVMEQHLHKGRPLRLLPVAKVPSSKLTRSRLSKYVAEVIRLRTLVPVSPPRRASNLDDGDPPVVRFSDLLKHEELRLLAERVAKREDSLSLAASSTPSSNRVLLGSSTPATTGQDLPRSKLRGSELAAKVKKLMERAVQQLVDDGVIVITPVDLVQSPPSSASGKRPRRLQTEEAYSFPSWRVLGPPILSVLARPTKPSSSGRTRGGTEKSTAEVTEALQRSDERWAAIDEAKVREVLEVLMGMERVQALWDGKWRAIE